MLECEDYKMFRGIMRIAPPNPKFPTEEIEATWLYKPEYQCWYGNGRSYDESICTIVRDDTP